MALVFKRLGMLIAAVGLASTLAAFAWPARSPITIQAPAFACAGTLVCIEVVSLNGKPTVSFEVKDVKITPNSVTEIDATTTKVCVKVPAGTAGSNLVVTVVTPGGGLATASIPIH